MTEQGVEFESVNYIERPLSLAGLKDLLRCASLKPLQAMRSKEPAFRQLIAGKDLSNDELLQIMVSHPELLQRPIVVRENKAVLARPVENLSKLGLKA